MIFDQTSVVISGLRIDEPVTALTDLLISTVCFVAYRKLSRVNLKGRIYVFLKYYFLTMFLVTLVSGLLGHAFYAYFSDKWKILGWMVSMVSITLLEYASVEYVRPLIGNRVAKIFLWFVLAVMVVFIYLLVTTGQFLYVAVHTAFGMILIVASLHLYVYMKRRSRGSVLFLIAVCLSTFSAIIFMNQWGFGKWFNHLDVSHMFLAVSAHYTYLGSVTILKNPLLI